jgi:hypothetical protein
MDLPPRQSLTVSGQIRIRGDGLAPGCIAACLVAKVIKRIASVCAYAMDQFHGKSAGESMESRKKEMRVSDTLSRVPPAARGQEIRKLSPR